MLFTNSTEQPGRHSLWRQVWSEQRQGVYKNLAAGHLGFLHSCLAAYGAEEGGWQLQCLGTALMSDGVRLLLLLHSPSQGDCHVDTARLYAEQSWAEPWWITDNQKSMALHLKHLSYSVCWLAPTPRQESIRHQSSINSDFCICWRKIWFIRNNMIPLAYRGYSSKQQKHNSLFFFFPFSFKCYSFAIIDIKQHGNHSATFIYAQSIKITVYCC